MDEQAATQILPPPPPMAEIELPALINTATRKQHIELNRLIVERLPLGLPPNATNPATLGHGLAVFARIYYTFEAAWDELILCDENQNVRDGNSLHQKLVDLHIVRLCRTSRLKNAIAHIAAITGEKEQATLGIEQQALLDSMASLIQFKPHVLVAYAWVMYMAIFSGGRWIRSQLASAGNHFWTGESSFHYLEKPTTDTPGFSFLHFDGDRDGEDIKEEFKLRLKAVDEVLSADEKDDIIQAAKTLFDDCIMLIHMLDVDIQTRKAGWTWSWISLFGVAGSVATLLRIFVRSFT